MAASPAPSSASGSAPSRQTLRRRPLLSRRSALRASRSCSSCSAPRATSSAASARCTSSARASPSSDRRGFREGHRYYELGREVGARARGLGFTVMTGGGPGVMEAANRGAQEAGGRSVGCNITLAHEQFPNPYLDRYVTCHYFFVRKVLLFKYSYAFVVLARRPRHARRADRSADADSDRQDSAVPRRPHGRGATGSRLPTC